MRRTAGMFLFLILALSSMVASPWQEAQRTLYKDQDWTVTGPATIACRSLLATLTASGGNGTIFAYPAALTAALSAVAAVVQAECPTMRRIAIVSAGEVRTFPLPRASASQQPSPPSTSRPAPVPSVPSVQSATQVPSAEFLADPVVAISTRPLQSIDSVRSAEEKCEVLLQWLSRIDLEYPGVGRNLTRPLMVYLYRDEDFTAVFGKTFDNTTAEWRLEFHGDVIEKCQGRSRGRSVLVPGSPFRQYAQRLDPFRVALDVPFLPQPGQPGIFSPDGISRAIATARVARAQLDVVLLEASGSPATLESFRKMGTTLNQLTSQFGVLWPSERQRLKKVLDTRRSEIAVVITDGWIGTIGAYGRTLEEARRLRSDHQQKIEVIALLEKTGQENVAARVDAKLNSILAPFIDGERPKLRAIPPTLSGVHQMSAWKAAFDNTFAQFRTVPVVRAAGDEFARTRAQTFAGALPSWLEQVEGIPLETAAIATKRRELDTLFQAREERSSSEFSQFEAPLRAREDQLRTRIEADSRKERAASQAGANTALTAESFSAKGLSNEQTFMRLFRGDFVNIGFNRDELQFGDILEKYIHNYSHRCSAYLPSNKVELKNSECTRERVTSTGFNVVVSRECIEWKTVGTGVYADPTLYAAWKTIEPLVDADNTRSALRSVLNPDPVAGLASTINMARSGEAITHDIGALLQMNSCGGPGLMRFEENLRLFALNQPSLRLPGDASVPSAETTPVRDTLFVDQNYKRLLEDLIADQSKTWTMNRFVAGTVTASVASRDAAGRPSKIVAQYIFNNRAKGSVTLTFKNGLPECMYFFDATAVCRTPNRRIVNAYEAGDYQK